jgi:site-specific recombinase XerD
VSLRSIENELVRPHGCRAPTVTTRRDPHRDDLEAAPYKGAIAIPYDWKTEVSGVFARHADECPVRIGQPCTCGPLGYRASIREWETNRRVLSPTFPGAEEAEAWLRDQRQSLEAAGRVALASGDLGAVVEEFLKAAENGLVEAPSGGRYSVDGLREIRGALSHVAAELGGRNIEDVGRSDVEELLARLQRSGLSASRVDSVVAGLHALFLYAAARDLVAANPLEEVMSAPATSSGKAGTSLSSGAHSFPAVPPPDTSGSAPTAPAPRRPPTAKSRRSRSAGPTLETLARQFLRAADEGSIDRRPGEPYTHETLLDLRGSMSYVDDRLRAMALRDIRRRHIQKLVDDLRSVGLPSSVVETVVDSLRSLYAYAIHRNLVDFSPVVELTMPDAEGSADERATWAQVPPTPRSPLPPLTQAPLQPPPAFASAQAPTQPPPPYQSAIFPPPEPAPQPPQPPPSGPDWEYYGNRARETLAPTTAMMALGGRVVAWMTRLALIAFVLLVLVLARELGLFALIR